MVFLVVDFLNSYWWLIIPALLIIGFFVKKILKIMIILTIVILSVVAFWQLVLGKPAAIYLSCWNPMLEKIDAYSEEARSLTPGKELDAYLCENLGTSLMEGYACLKSAQLETSPIAFKILVPYLTQSGKTMAELQNSKCPNNNVESFDFIQ